MCFVYVGGTIKITWADRQAQADQLLVEHVELTDADILEVGCSDGSTSVDLIDKLPGFRSFTMTDRFLEIDWVEVDGKIVFFDKEGVAVLVSGRRFVVWPHLSQAAHLLVSRTLRKSAGMERRPCLLLNPRARSLVARDARVGYAEHDVFTDWQGAPVDVIKTGNLLRRLYFDDETIARGLMCLHRSLKDGGHLLLADHSRVEGEPPAGGLYRRTDSGFELIAATPRRPEIHDLVDDLAVTDVTS
jgi:SAM-dependent methyltransferase